MSWNCSIRIVDSAGDGVSGIRVTLFEGSLLGGYFAEYTDSDGWAKFEIEAIEKSGWTWDNVYVDGEEVCGSLSINDGETLSFTV